MTRTFATILLAGVLLFAKGVSAHRIDEYLQATILSVESNRIEGSMRLIPGILVSPSVIAGIDSNGDGAFSESEEQGYAQRVIGDLSVVIDGKQVRPVLVSFSFPEPAQMREGMGEIHIDYAVTETAEARSGQVDRSLIITNRHLNGSSVYLINVLVPKNPAIRIVRQKRNEQQSVYELDFQQTGTANTAGRAPEYKISVGSGSLAWLKRVPFATLFELGMRHIAEGTDHLLFLLVLLLPAPIVVCGGRWDHPATARRSLVRILGIVTAFTIGHSITLSVAALSASKIPSRPVEVLIAVSILVSAVHAWRPVFPGKEPWIAAFFGLIHGLAFASTLDRLGLGRWDRVAGILAFNMGIEAMQMIVVAAMLPSLILMSRTRLYPTIRNGGAIFAGLASVGWIAERLFDVRTPVDVIVNGVARHAPMIAANLLIVSIACKFLAGVRTSDRPTT